MKRTKPPFRADHVGSLLRTGPIKEARAKRERGEINAAQLKEVEDREIPKVIKKQEEAGLHSITDGEERRAWWHLDFLEGLDGTGVMGPRLRGDDAVHLAMFTCPTPRPPFPRSS